VKVCWSPLPTPATDHRFLIAVRKRPLWEWEATQASEGGDNAYDLLSVDAKRKRCVLHDARLDRQHQTFTYHREYAMDRFYDDQATDAAVFQGTVQPLLARALTGEKATMIAFGQTGTGIKSKKNSRLCFCVLFLALI
jgi:hypothetical protein